MGESEAESDFREVAADLAELMATVGLLDSICQTWPENVQENWQREKVKLRGQIQQRSEELQLFAEAYDEEGDASAR